MKKGMLPMGDAPKAEGDDMAQMMRSMKAKMGEMMDMMDMMAKMHGGVEGGMETEEE